MSNCCDDPKIALINAKCEDQFMLRTKDIKYDGYVPYNLGLGGGEHLQFSVCLSCGKLENFDAPDLSDFLEDNRK